MKFEDFRLLIAMVAVLERPQTRAWRWARRTALFAAILFLGTVCWIYLSPSFGDVEFVAAIVLTIVSLVVFVVAGDKCRAESVAWHKRARTPQKETTIL